MKNNVDEFINNYFTIERTLMKKLMKNNVDEH